MQLFNLPVDGFDHEYREEDLVLLSSGKFNDIVLINMGKNMEKTYAHSFSNKLMIFSVGYFTAQIFYFI